MRNPYPQVAKPLSQKGELPAPNHLLATALQLQVWHYRNYELWLYGDIYLVAHPDATTSTAAAVDSIQKVTGDLNY